MSLHFINMDRASKFEASVVDDRKDPTLKTLVVKGFDIVNLTLKPDQLREIGKAISAETGGSDSPF